MAPKFQVTLLVEASSFDAAKNDTEYAIHYGDLAASIVSIQSPPEKEK